MRSRTIELLAEQHPEASLEELCERAKGLRQQYDEEFEAYLEAMKEFSAVLREMSAGLEREGKGKRPRPRSKGTDLGSSNGQATTAVERMQGLLTHAEELGVALSAYRDDRALRAIISLYEDFSSNRLIEPLASFGTQRAARALAADLERAVQYREARMEAGEDTAQAEATLEGLQAALEGIARAAGHADGLPERSDDAARAWSSWLREHGDSLAPEPGDQPLPWEAAEGDSQG